MHAISTELMESVIQYHSKFMWTYGFRSFSGIRDTISFYISVNLWFLSFRLGYYMFVKMVFDNFLFKSIPMIKVPTEVHNSVWIPNKISLKFVPKGPINNTSALVQIMAWRHPGDKPLSELMMVSLPTHICVTRPQWVKQYNGDGAVLCFWKMTPPIFLSGR